MRNRLVATLILAGAVWGCLLAPSLAKAAESKICFYVDSPHAPLPTGHAFVQLLPGSGPQAGRKDLVYGHHPKSPDPFSSGGVTKSDAEHSWDWKICYSVTVDQYNAVARYIRGEIDHPSDFHLFGHNCTHWVHKIGGIAGLELPRIRDLDTPNLFDPSVFEDSLKAIGAGHTSHGGVVHNNPKHVTPKDSADPPADEPDVCSYRGLAALASADPAGLAANLRMKSVDADLGARRVGVGKALTLRLRGVAAGNAIVLIDFGDGKPVRQRLTAAHVYATSGERTATVLIVNRGAVDRFRLRLNVVAGAGPVSSVVDVPPSPPSPPPFEASPRPPEPDALGAG